MSKPLIHKVDLEELGDTVEPIRNGIRKIFEDTYVDIFEQQYAKNVNMFYLQYKKDHNLTKQFSKDGKIFYHDVEV